MDLSILERQVQRNLEMLCNEIANRHVGSPGNREAADWFARTIAQFGFETSLQEFDCLDWDHGEVTLTLAGQNFPAYVSPYSLSCHASKLLVRAENRQELSALDCQDKILLIHGELAREQLLPKNFTFYNPPEHQEIYRLLEAKRPAAIIAATGKNPELAGSLYPFPLFEDGDFDLPSVYLKDSVGIKLLKHVGPVVQLEFDSERIPAKGANVIARKGDPAQGKIVICAHLDTKKNTPGALDNGSGIVTLLALAELMQHYAGLPQIEIVALNGEDYYSAPGQVLYLRENETELDAIKLAINLDCVGYRGSNASFSCYECAPQVVDLINKTTDRYPEIIMGDPWFQGDHMIFVQQQRPALAITSDNFVWLCQEITHTPKDRLELLDCGQLAVVAEAIYALINEYNS